MSDRDLAKPLEELEAAWAELLGMHRDASALKGVHGVEIPEAVTRSLGRKTSEFFAEFGYRLRIVYWGERRYVVYVHPDYVETFDPRWCDPQSRSHLPPWAIVNVSDGRII